MKILSLSSLFALSMLGLACIVAPTNGDPLLNEMDFEGFALSPDVDVELQVLNRNTNVWETFATVTPSSTPTTINGDTMHRWRIDDVSVISGSRACYVSATCAGGDGEVLVRGLQPGSGPALTTFDEGGVQCVGDELNSGTSWFTAGERCQSSQSPTLHLTVVD